MSTNRDLRASRIPQGRGPNHPPARSSPVHYYRRLHPLAPGARLNGLESFTHMSQTRELLRHYPVYSRTVPAASADLTSSMPWPRTTPKPKRTWTRRRPEWPADLNQSPKISPAL